MRTSRISFALAVMCWVLTSRAFAANSVCLSGVCLGDDIQRIPKSVPWKITVYPDASKSAFSQKEWSTRLAKTIQADPAVLKELTPFSYPFGELKALNGKTISALGKIRGVCAPITLEGTFASESGYETTVKARVFPSDDASSQTIRVVSMHRLYKGTRTAEEIDALASKLEDQFKVPVQASFTMPVRGEFTRHLGGTPPDVPRAKLGYESLLGGTKLDIFFPASMEENVERTISLLRKFPGCSIATKVD